MASNRFYVVCLECGKKFLTASSLPHCPRCNSADIEPIYEIAVRTTNAEDFGGAFDGFTVTSDADGGL